MLQFRKKLTLWLPVFLWAAVIFTLSSIKQVQVSEFFAWDFLAKKTAHVLEYTIFYALIFRATGKKYILSYILALAYAASDEFHQHYVLGRSATVIDIGIDLSGANISSYILWKLNQNPKKKQKKQAKS